MANVKHFKLPETKTRTSQPMPNLMTLDELADYLRVHPSSIYRRMKDSNLPGFKLGSDWRFSKESIDRWCMERERAR